MQTQIISQVLGNPYLLLHRRSPCSSFWMVCSTPGKIFHGLWVFKYFGHLFPMDLLFLGNPYPGRGGRLFAGEKE